MSKDTYSDDKKIESFKSLEIASGQNTTASNGNLTLSTSNQNDVIISPDRDVRLNGRDTSVFSSRSFLVNTQSVDILAGSDLNLLSQTTLSSYAISKNYIQSSNMIELDAAGKIYIDSETTVDIRANYIKFMSSTDISLGNVAETNNIFLNAQRVRYSSVGGPVGDHRLVVSDNARFIIHESYQELSSTAMNYESFKFYCRDSDSGYLAYIANSSSTDGTDILFMDFPNKTDAGSNSPADVYIRFQVGGLPAGGDGSIQGYIAGTIKLLEAGEPAFRGYQTSVDTVANNAEIADAFSSDPLVIGNNNDGVCYATGNSDFGEWIECGDKNEWSDIVDIDFYSNITLKDTHIKRLGLIEGMVAYIRDLKFWRSGPGTPMLVTRRAAVLGNRPGSNSNYVGEVFSFIGQISVLVEGTASCGDYIIPKKNHCIAIPKDEITFEQYRDALGVCWQNKTTSELGRVMCAIGKK